MVLTLPSEFQVDTDTVPVTDLISVAVKLRPPERIGLEERFTDIDPSPGWDLARNPRIARLMRNRKFQFALIVPTSS